MRSAMTGRSVRLIAGIAHICREATLGAVVLLAAVEDFRRAAQHDPAEPRPIFVIAVDDERGAGFSMMLRTRFKGMPRRLGFSSMVM